MKLTIIKMNIITRKIFIAICSCALLNVDAEAQEKTYNADQYVAQTRQEPSKSATEKLQILQKSYSDIIEKLSTDLNRIPSDPNILGSKELFESIDEMDREMKRIKMGCAALLNSLRNEEKAIKLSSSFTDEQKTDLLESAGTITKECAVLSAKLDHALGRLAYSYTAAPRWKTVHRTYRNLQGEAKAAEQVKSQIELYINSFTENLESESEPIDTAKSLKSTLDKEPKSGAP